MQKYYLIGALSLVVFFLISWMVTKNPNPFALAKGKGSDGENSNYSASLFQMLVFTMLTVFAYTTVFAARVGASDGVISNWIEVPTNLLILMGISAGTAVASKAIRVEQKKNGALSGTDESSLTTNRDGKTDLVKIQMLVWTLVAVAVYLTILKRFMENTVFETGTLPLPDIDTTFMVLLGVSQGGYVVNQLSEGTEPTDK